MVCNSTRRIAGLAATGKKEEKKSKEIVKETKDKENKKAKKKGMITNDKNRRQ